MRSRSANACSKVIELNMEKGNPHSKGSSTASTNYKVGDS